MAQNCSNKVVSLHISSASCCNPCSVASVCYHLKKEMLDRKRFSNIKLKDSLCISRYIIHESVCKLDFVTLHNYKERLTNFRNFNITVSSNNISPETFIDYLGQVQVSVYSAIQALHFKSYQKLFLIHDHLSFEFFKQMCGDEKLGQLHFNIDQQNIDLDLLKLIIKYYNDHATKNQSLDSCLMSYVINGRCPFDNGNYIDISWDSTVRKCPFNPKGKQVDFNKVDISTLFDTEVPEYACKYKDYFGGNK